MSAPPAEWEVYAVKYAERLAPTRRDCFLFDDRPGDPCQLDYFVWVVRSGDRTILVDTGYDRLEAGRRDRAILREPPEALKPLGIDAETITDVIVTHLHYDHAGGLHLFPNAQLHIQAAEMAYATGPCMCHGALQMPFSADHVCEAVKRVYSGRVTFYEGDAEVADGITVHHIGGHSRGLQAVRVRTQTGWLCLASDAAHFYETLWEEKPFPIVVDMEAMLHGFARLKALASSPELIIPGHDPLVSTRFPSVFEDARFILRLDVGPTAGISAS